MKKLREHLSATYFSFDARSLALFRVVFSIVLLKDLWLRAKVLDYFYTNDGLLPNHTLLWAPPARRMFSIFFTASNRGEVIFLMILCALAFLSLLVGYRTKLAQVASLIALTSLNTRLAVLENGGDMVVNLLAVWTVFLPLGKRFSIDALRTSLRAHPDKDASDLVDRRALHDQNTRVYSLACFALILQFFFVYYFNVVHKTGPTWIDGSAVHYTLHQDRLITGLGVWMRENIPFELLRLLAWGAVATEAFGALMIISPVFTTYTRAAAVIAMPLLHASFEASLDLGVFSYGMMSFFALLPLAVHWEWISKQLGKLHKKRRVYYDADCGVCFQIVRILARLDAFDKLEILPNTDTSRLPANVTPELLDATIVVIDEDSGTVLTRVHAVSAILRSLPFGHPPGLMLLIPGIHQVANSAYDSFAKNRAQISTFLGYGVCGVPSQISTAAAEPPAPWRASCARFGNYVATVCIALIMISAVGEIVNANAAVPRALRYRQPAFFQAIVEYPRLLQGWRMFAPHAPLEDFMIEVDATTVDGRHVDPYNVVATRMPGPGYKEIPPLLGQVQFFTGYSLFIWRPHFRAYLTAFREWIMRYHERTGHPKDRIVRFTASVLSDKSPPPGKIGNTDFKREVFLKYPDTKRSP